MSFITDYIKFVELNEAHPNYHLWSALTGLAALVGRKVWLDRQYYRIYPNLYTILIGPAGNRKTAAKNILQDVLRDIGGIDFASEATTREALIQEMETYEKTYMFENVLQAQKPVMVCVTELKEFLSVDPARMINFLTAIYDQDFFDYSTKGKGKNVLENPCLNLLACETPDWIMDRLKDRVVQGGFSRRVIYVYETDHERLVVKKLPDELIQARKRVVARGKEIAKIVGPYSWCPKAEDFFDKWYVEHKVDCIPSMKAFYESKHTLILKLCMLFSAAESNERIIEQQHLAASFRVLAEAEKKMPNVFAGSGRNELGIVVVKAMQFLEQRKTPIALKTFKAKVLFTDCRTSFEQDEVIQQLQRTGKVARYVAGDKEFIGLAGYRPSEPVDLNQAGAQQSSVPAEPRGSGLAAAAGRPSAPLLAPSGTPAPVPESQADVPEASAPDTTQPPGEQAS